MRISGLYVAVNWYGIHTSTSFQYSISLRHSAARINIFKDDLRIPVKSFVNAVLNPVVSCDVLVNLGSFGILFLVVIKLVHYLKSCNFFC